MTIHRKLIRAQISSVGDDEVDVIMSTAALARDGHILLPQGCMLDNYRSNPIVLWSHDSDHPIGNAENVTVTPDQITARIRFAPMGISHKADEVRGLMKAGVIRAVSVGFEPIDMEPIDPKKPRGGQRISAWELLELSAVSVPADTGAVVTARALGEDDMTDRQTAPSAPAAIAGARGAPVVVARAGAIRFKRGLYQVAELCYLFQELGWHVDMAQWEAECEKDESKVPGMLAAILHDLGDALLAMTAEEIAEALSGYDLEPDIDAADLVLVVDDRQHIANAPSPAIRAFRRGLAQAKVRTGKTLSADTVDCLREFNALHDDAMTTARSALAKHKKAQGVIADLMDRAGVTDEGDSETEANAADPAEGADGARTNENAEVRRRQIEIRRRRAAA